MNKHTLIVRTTKKVTVDVVRCRVVFAFGVDGVSVFLVAVRTDSLRLLCRGHCLVYR